VIHLVLGGARSGKSGYAEQWTADQQRPVTVIATATADDDEMANRIAHHKGRRPTAWQVIEEPLFLSRALSKVDPSHVIMIDCLTLWLSNWLCKADRSLWQKQKTDFLNQLYQLKQPLVMVSNEVGSGIVPLGELSRQFVDQAGWLNQSIAALADQVTLVVAGLPLLLKSRAQSS
jgi:adenosylcobinamide kinase/adenosylcobinamide-phosphate guanylyltransferase